MTYDNYPKYVITRAGFNGNTYQVISVLSLMEFFGGNEKNYPTKTVQDLQLEVPERF
jgi:hypothetical protein